MVLYFLHCFTARRTTARYLDGATSVDACACIRVLRPPPPALAAHVSACVPSSDHASPALSPTASASAHGLEVLEQPEAVGRVRLGPALDREEVEPRGGLLALLEELRLELLLRVLYPRQQVPAGPKRRTAPKRRACGWRRPGRKAARLAAPAPLRQLRRCSKICADPRLVPPSNGARRCQKEAA